MKPDTSPSDIAAEPFSTEQQRYLEGFFAGIQAHGVTFADLETAPRSAAVPALDDLTKEERLKQELHPLDATEELLLKARWNAPPETEDVFRFKWNGLFWLSPVKDGYMCRLRIPGGMIRSHQLREVARISRELTTGYIQITTRSNLQLRLIEPRHCPEVLRRIQSCGLHSRGSGADNIRNITMSPAAGYDPDEITDVRPLVQELATLILSSREFYDLPRKFNIAYEGGGGISSVEDTNDIGVTACRLLQPLASLQPGVHFRMALGGATGHQTFAEDCDVLIPEAEVNRVIVAVLRVFMRHGDRTNRKRARLKHLIDSMGLAALLERVEKQLGTSLVRLPAGFQSLEVASSQQQGHHHVGVRAQKQVGKFCIGAHVPVGQLTADQLDRVADVAEHYGDGEVRLTVWQNLLIPNIPETYVETVCRALRKIHLPTTSSTLRNGFIACTGNRYCKYASADTKGHALQVMHALDQRITLDQPVNIHFTGCPHSCAQHFIGDIGLLGTKAKNEAGESVEGYHIVVGGGFGSQRKIGRQIFTAVPATALTITLESMLRGYLQLRLEDESFHQFCNRHEVRQLQEIFCHA